MLDELHLFAVVFRKKATKPARAVPLASARQHLDVETQAGHSPERAVEGPAEGVLAERLHQP